MAVIRQSGLEIDLTIQTDSRLTQTDADWLQDELLKILGKRGWSAAGAVRLIDLEVDEE